MRTWTLAFALVLLTAVSLPARGWGNVDPGVLDDALKKSLDLWKTYDKNNRSAEDFDKKYTTLTPDDEEYDGAYDDPGAPQVPSSCAGSDECGACFEQAYDDLNRQRFRLAKLRRIYLSTMRMGKSALAFGDNASGVHGVAGLGWQLQGRKPIEQSMKSFQNTSVAKYEEIIGDLHEALQAVGVCEAEHFDEGSWYDRFGFMYYQFMAERYRPDEY
jgi:hypothetical protein